MHTYDFISKKITLNQVKQIISTAGNDASRLVYTARVSGDGWVATGDIAMALSPLEKAARDLNITVEIVSGPAAGRRMTAAAGTPYSVTIAMSSDTVQALLQGGYQLYGFKAVAGTGAGQPLVWFATSDFSAVTTVEWTEEYQAYTSSSELIPNGEIVASFSADVALGQQLNVGVGGVGTVVAGPAGVIGIDNTTSTPFTCGLAQAANGVSAPICAFNLYGNGIDSFIPVEKVLFTFATKPVDTGTVIEQAFSAGVLLDLTGVAERQISYDINLGFTWGGYSWGTPVAAGDALTQLLVEDNVSLATRRV